MYFECRFRASLFRWTPSVIARLSREIEGEVLTGVFDRGRYATDASIYQIMPRGVVVPKTWNDVRAAREIAAEAGISLLPRGGGTSQAGQTVNDSLVLDFSKHLNSVVAVDAERATATVEPGLVLDQLNARLRPHGCGFRSTSPPPRAPRSEE